MNNKYTAMDVANLIIIYANQIPTRTGSLTPIKLQKILYYVYLECLKGGVKLFETPIEKWKFGPVVSPVYHNFKAYGVRHINEPSSSYVFDENEEGFHFEEIPFSPESIQFDPEIKTIIREKVEELIDVDPFELVERTHREKPWKDYEQNILNGERGLIYSDIELMDWLTSKEEN